MSLMFGILTVSDSCYNGKEDVAGKKLFNTIQEVFPSSIIPFVHIVPDDKFEIQNILNKWIDAECNVILTVGGTGFSARDVTPEATKAVIEREAPGLAYTMITKSLSITPMAMLSRSVCGIKNKSVIINLPGSEKAAIECFSFIYDGIPHCVSILTDNKIEIEAQHKVIQKAIFANIPFNSNSLSVPSKVKIDNIAARSRISPYPLIEVENIYNIIKQEICPTSATEIIPIDQALHRILSENIKAIIDVPPVNVSLKDGYAIRNDYYENYYSSYSLIGCVAAGDTSKIEITASGNAMRICTGAPVPKGTTKIVPVEDTNVTELNDCQEEATIRISNNSSDTCATNIRIKGSDIKAGTVVLNRLDCIKPAHIGILVSLGITEVKVFKRYSIGLISTGNELISHKEELADNKIFDSNKITLMQLLKQFSYKSNDCGIARDEPNEIKSRLENALNVNDILITTGGVSMGEYDLIKEVLIQDFGAIIHFGRVNMKPGKPTTFATLLYNGKLKIIFGLPGNPVSAHVTCLLFVIPTLKYMERNADWMFPKIQCALSENLINSDSRPEFVRVKICFGETNIAHSTGNQASSRLNSLVGANALLLLPGNYVNEEEEDTEKTFDTYLIDTL